MSKNKTEYLCVNDYILVRPEKPKEKSKGGIYLPENNVAANNGPRRGLVVSAPVTRWVNGVKQSVCVQAGQTVLFSGYTTALNQVDEDTVLIHEGDIMAIVTEGANVK